MGAGGLAWNTNDEMLETPKHIHFEKEERKH